MGNFFNCPTYPEVQPWKLYSGSDSVPTYDELCGDFDPALQPCADTLDNLVCLIQNAEENDCDEVLVCSGAEIDFYEGLAEFFAIGVTLEVPDGLTIGCEDCDCTFVRTVESLTYTLCPFFTTQLGNDFSLKGVSMLTDDIPSMENVISFSDYEMVDLSQPFDADIESSLKEAKCNDSFKSAKKCAGKTAKSGKATSEEDPIRRRNGRRNMKNSVYKGSANTPNFMQENTKKNTLRKEEQEQRRLLDLCKNDAEVKVFHQTDTNNDEKVTCIEAELALDKEGYPVTNPQFYNCNNLFTRAVNTNKCFDRDENGDLILSQNMFAN